jgi:hypothetical protein
MTTKAPDHHDAELVFRAYDLRRESVMRESRSALLQKLWPKSYEELAAVLKPDHPLNAAYRQVSTYWEMVYGVVKHGIVNPDYFLESNGEGLFLFARVAPFLETLRRESSPTVYQNAEWVSKETAVGRRLFAMFSERVRKVLETK